MRRVSYKNALLSSMRALFVEGWEFVRGAYVTNQGGEKTSIKVKDLQREGVAPLPVMGEIRTLHEIRLEYQQLYRSRAPRNLSECLKTNSSI